MRRKRRRKNSSDSVDPRKVSMQFSHGGVFGGGHWVEWDGKKSELRWRANFGFTCYPLKPPSAIQWKAFWLLVEQAGVKEWDYSYVNPGILDGVGWSFRLKAPGLSIETSGSNAYPGSGSLIPTPSSQFDVLTTAIGILVGCDLDELKAPTDCDSNRGGPSDHERDSGEDVDPLV